MNVARVAAHASASEAESWAKRQGQGDSSARPAPQDLRAAWRASLEAFGITVVE